MIVRLAERSLRTRFGEWREVLYYRGLAESIALVYGAVRGERLVPCRLHSQCISSHVFNSIECDCRDQMKMAQKLIAARGRGVVVLLAQEGRGNGHLALMKAAELSAEESILQSDAYRRVGFETDARRYTEAAEILHDLGVGSIELLSNNPAKERDLRDLGIEVEVRKRLAVNLKAYPHLAGYYAERAMLGHDIDPTP